MDLFDATDKYSLWIIFVAGDDVEHPVDPITTVYEDRAAVVIQQFAGFISPFVSITGAVRCTAVCFRFCYNIGILMAVRESSDEHHADHGFGDRFHILLKETAVHYSM